MMEEQEHYVVFLVYRTERTEILDKDFSSFDQAQEYMDKEFLIPYEIYQCKPGKVGKELVFRAGNTGKKLFPFAVKKSAKEVDRIKIAELIDLD